MLPTTCANQLSAPQQPTEAHNKVRNTRNERLQSPLYRELITYLFKNSVYDPTYMNLNRRVGDIMTGSNCKQVLRDCGLDSDDPQHMNTLRGYIKSFSGRLHGNGIKRSDGTRTPPTTFYTEYMRVFERKDPFNLEAVTKAAQVNFSTSTSSIVQKPQDVKHIEFNRGVVLLGVKIVTGEQGRDIRVYKVGRARSACTGGIACRCKENMFVLVQEVYEDPWTEDNLIEGSDVLNAIGSEFLACQTISLDASQKYTYMQWPRHLLMEKARTAEEILNERIVYLIDTLDRQKYKRRCTVDERLQQLSRWVKQKRLETASKGQPFVCPKPRNRNKEDLESQLGNWLNSKVHEAKDKRKAEEKRMKVIELLNGPVADILGYQENWFCGKTAKNRASMIGNGLTDVNNSDAQMRGKRKSVCMEEVPDSGRPCKQIGLRVRSTRERQIKPNMSHCYDY